MTGIANVRKGSDVPVRVRLMRELEPYRHRLDVHQGNVRRWRAGAPVISFSGWVVRYRPDADTLTAQLDELDGQIMQRVLRIHLLQNESLIRHQQEIFELYEQILDLIEAQEQQWRDEASGQAHLTRVLAIAAPVLAVLAAAAALL